MAFFISFSMFGAATVSFTASWWITSYHTVESPLATLFIEGARNTLFESGVFLFLCGLLFFTYAISKQFQDTIHQALTIIEKYVGSLSPVAHFATLFVITALFLYALNATGITQGHFHADDFALTERVASYSIQELVWMPYSEHAMPLNWVQTALFYKLFGTNPVPYNIFLLLLATALPLCGYMLLRTLGYGLTSLFFILAVFGGSVIASEFLAGFYALWIYPEVLVFFLLSVWTYVRSQTSAQPHYLLALSFMCLFIATFFDISGIWTTGAYALFAYIHHIAKHKEWSPWVFMRDNKTPLISAALILAAFFLYLARLSVVQSEPFLVGNNALSFSILKQVYDVYTAGVIAQLFLPSAGIIVSQPRFLALLPMWSLLMALLVLVFGIVLYLFFRHGSTKTRLYGAFIVTLLMGTGLLTALGRPTSHPAAFFPIQQIVMPFFWFSIILTLAMCEYMKCADKLKREGRALVVVGFCIVVLSVQHVFSFYKDQNIQEVLDSKRAVATLQTTLVPALNDITLQSKEKTEYIPNLRGQYVNPFLFGRDASQYKAFLNMPPNIRFLDVRHGPYLASTSPIFIKALDSDARLRSLYLQPIEIEVAYGTTTLSEQIPLFIESNGEYELPMRPQIIATQKTGTLVLDMTISEESEKVYFNISFANALHATGTNAIVRIDQYSRRLPNIENRRYVLVLDLNQIYAFALSKEISNLTLTFATPGAYVLHGYEWR